MINTSYSLNNNPSIYYYIVEKDFQNVRLLTEKLNDEKFVCLGVSHNIKGFSEIFNGMLIKPTLLFVGFQNITTGALDQIDYFSKVHALKIIFFNDDISEYSDSFGISHDVIEV